jgi:hypothetical protein
VTYPALPQPSGTPNFEEFLDMLAYMLATNEHTEEVAWIIGDVGMGAPQQTPFGYIAPRNDNIPWLTANGSKGGLPGGPRGLDDHLLVVPVTVAVQPHSYLQPVDAAPPEASPLSMQSLGIQAPYFEQPGYRAAMDLQDRIRLALRENITIGGEVITTTIVETTYVLQKIEGDLFRALRITIQAQQRRRR